jgi:predicted esterase
MLIHQFIQGTAPYTVLLLHGTGGDETDLLPIGKSLAPGANLLSPRGNVSENGAPRFFRRLAHGIFDVEDVKVRAMELAAFIAEKAAQYQFDASSVYALGYSNGANMAHAMMLLHPGVLAGAVLLRPMPVIELPHGVHLNGVPVLIVAGDEDTLTTPELTHQLATLLSEAGAKVDVKWIASGHNLTPFDFQVVQVYFKTLKAHGSEPQATVISHPTPLVEEPGS